MAPTPADIANMGIITDDDFRALLEWAECERAIRRSLLAGGFGFGEFMLRRQLNYDRLIQFSRRSLL